MAQYTVTAFNWSSNGYNAQYNTSVTATFDDNDPNYQGGGDNDETVSINAGAFQATASLPYNISVSFTDINGDPFVEDFYFFNTGGAWYFAPGPGSAFTVGATLGSYQSHTVGWQYADIVCFTSGTLIETGTGPRLIEDLTPGDKVRCADGSFSPLRLIMRRDIDGFDLFQNPNLYPVRILAGALGAGIPSRDLLVSRQHRLLVRSAIADRMFGQSEVLVSAIRLTALPGIFVDEKVDQVSYFHLVFDDHEIVLAEGAPAESLLAGPQALASLEPDARAELLTLFPKIEQDKWTMRSAAKIPDLKHQKKLLDRHAKNQKPVLDSALERVAPQG